MTPATFQRIRVNMEKAGDMRVVSKDEFYKLIFDGKLDLVLNCEPEYTSYQFRNRLEWGRAYPGYLCKGPKKYIVRDQ